MAKNYGAPRVVCLVLVICCCYGVVPILGTDYTVGDLAGWSLGTDYSTWASNKTFNAGDKLVFIYERSHNVNMVSSDDFATCTVGDLITAGNFAQSTSLTNDLGNTNISLMNAGQQYYFICGVTEHCRGGMKLTVTVTGSSPPTLMASAAMILFPFVATFFI